MVLALRRLRWENHKASLGSGVKLYQRKKRRRQGRRSRGRERKRREKGR